VGLEWENLCLTIRQNTDDSRVGLLLALLRVKVREWRGVAQFQQLFLYRVKIRFHHLYAIAQTAHPVIKRALLRFDS